ncbi:MAG TPA: type II toxin-antitoxin system CcdA family antitoxin [Rhizomicrobium sp.]|jgi:antitoxin CcdA
MSKKGFAEPKRACHPPRQRNSRLGTRQRRKKPVNVSLDADLLAVAKKMGINLSQTLEMELDKLTSEERARRFYAENKAGIDAYNAFIEKHGTLAEAYYGKDAFDDPSI